MNTLSLRSHSIVIQCDQKIHKDDLRLLHLFFQTQTFSGGGEIHKLDHDEDKNRLYIKYLHSGFKEAVMRRQQFICEQYNFQAYDPLEIRCEKNKKRLIITNMRKTLSASSVQLYLDYLDEKNTVSEMKFSSILDSTLYVEFNDDIDLPSLKQKLIKLPDYGGKTIELYEAFSTNTVILELSGEQTPNDLKQGFIQSFNKTNKGCCDALNFDSWPFVVATFENSFMAKRYLKSNKTSDIAHVKNIEASWNETLTEEFISACISKNNSNSKLSGNSNTDVQIEPSDQLASDLSFNTMPSIGNASCTHQKHEQTTSTSTSFNTKFNVNHVCEITESIDDDLKAQKAISHYRYKRRTGRHYKSNLLCDKCPYRCSARKDFAGHRLKHVVRTKFQCELCSYNGANNSSTKKHQRIHKRHEFVKEIKTEKNETC